MNHRSLAALIVLNLALLAALAVTVFTPQPAEAQFGGANQFLMLSGQITGREQQAVVYIIAIRSGNMVAAIYNGSNKKLDFIARRSVANDMRRAAGR